MDIIERSRSRLVLVVRPWGQSLSYLGLAGVMSYAMLEAMRLEEPPATLLFLCLTLVILWAGFFVHAQRSDLTFDRKSDHLRIAHQRVFGRGGTIVPLSVIETVRAERVIRIGRMPWQYRLIATIGDEAIPTVIQLVPGLFKGAEAKQAAAGISDWLDSSRAAA